jgi:hypothetical protein
MTPPTQLLLGILLLPIKALSTDLPPTQVLLGLLLLSVKALSTDLPLTQLLLNPLLLPANALSVVMLVVKATDPSDQETTRRYAGGGQTRETSTRIAVQNIAKPPRQMHCDSLGNCKVTQTLARRR